MNDQLNKALEAARESVVLACGNLGEAFQRYAEAAAITTYRIGAIFGSFIEQQMLERRIKTVATPRQWHLYRYGPPKVSKKWRNALLRKVRIAEKRKGGRRA